MRKIIAFVCITLLYMICWCLSALLVANITLPINKKISSLISIGDISFIKGIQSFIIKNVILYTIILSKTVIFIVVTVVIPIILMFGFPSFFTGFFLGFVYKKEKIDFGVLPVIFLAIVTYLLMFATAIFHPAPFKAFKTEYSFILVLIFVLFIIILSLSFAIFGGILGLKLMKSAWRRINNEKNV